MVMTVHPSARRHKVQEIDRLHGTHTCTHARMHQVQEIDLAILNSLHERRVAFTIPGIYLCPSIQEKHYKPCVSAVM